MHTLSLRGPPTLPVPLILRPRLPPPRYYERFGWEPVREVTGDTLADLPHMVVWGGAGMRMDADIGRMMRRWSRAVALSAATGNMPTQPLEPEEC